MGQFSWRAFAIQSQYSPPLRPALPRRPEHKGKKERGIGYLKSNALRGRTFPGLNAENEFLRHWEKTVADVRLHGTTRQQVAARFAHEQPSLLPLPPDLFPCFQEGQRTVHRDSYVEVDKAYYSVPPESLGQNVWGRWDRREVRIFNCRWEQIKLHAHLSPGQFDQALGLGGGHGPLERQLDYWLKRAQELGGPCGQWSHDVLQRKGPSGLRSISRRTQSRRSRKKISRQVGTETMSFSLDALACSGIPKNRKPRTGAHPSPGRMQSLQSKDDPVLRLHSGRALSPEPCLQHNPNSVYRQEQIDDGTLN